MMCWGNLLVVAPLPHVSTYDGTRLMLQWGFLLAPELLLAAAANVLSRGKWARISAPRPRARLSSAGGALWTSCGGGQAQSIVRGQDESRHRAARSTCARARANTCARTSNAAATSASTNTSGCSTTVGAATDNTSAIAAATTRRSNICTNGSR